MKTDEQLDESLAQLGQALKSSCSIKERVMSRITAGNLTPVLSLPWYRRRAVKAFVGLAAGVAVAAGLWAMLGGAGANRAFAAAIDSIRHARTFSCINTFENTTTGQLFQNKIMFKEPDLDRVEWLTSAFPEFVGQTIIEDFGRRRQLVLVPSRKEAQIRDTSHDYEVNDAGDTGQSRMHTDARDSLLKLSARAAEDLGKVTLEGRTVRLLRDRNDQRTVQVWVDLTTGWPVQIVIERPGGHRSTISAIQIDVPLDDALFSTEVPPGYTAPPERVMPSSARTGKLLAQMRRLSSACAVYATSHNDQFPQSLTKLTTVGISEEVLRKLLADPDRPDGPAAITYRPPRPSADWDKEIVLYETFQQWPSGGIWVGFADSHCERIGTQESFQQMLK